jgi:hypothetical protein
MIGAAAARPIMARAEQADRVRRLGRVDGRPECVLFQRLSATRRHRSGRRTPGGSHVDHPPHSHQDRSVGD